MSWYAVTIIIHVIGAAIGVGSATATDSLFLRSIRDRVITTEQYNFLRTVSHVVTTGLTIVVLSGIALVLQNNAVLTQASFQAKMTFVLILILNGFVFHFFVLRFLREHCNERLSDETIHGQLWIFAGAGAISIVSWYGALILGVMGRLNLSVWVYLGVYVVLIVMAAVSAYLVLSHIIFSPVAQQETSDKASAEEREEAGGSGFSFTNIVLVVLLVLFIGSLAVIQVRAGEAVEQNTTNWAISGHADHTAQAFTHWDDDEPPIVPATCARCHSLHGILDYLGERGTSPGSVSQDMPIGTVVSCNACHNPTAQEMTVVEFPSGALIESRNQEAICLECHQGRESTFSVDEAIEGLDDDIVDDELEFIDVHYLVAAATLMGSEAQGGYEYADKAYRGRLEHTPDFQSCDSCHSPHHLQVDPLPCSSCHVYVTEQADLRNIRYYEVDYDGDGNTDKGIALEIDTFHERLYDAIRVYAQEVIGTPILYAPGKFPYFFEDVLNDEDMDPDELSFDDQYTEWTPRLVRAAYNYHYVHMDPGAFAHNPRYVMQILYDSLLDLSEEVPVELEDLMRPPVQ